MGKTTEEHPLRAAILTISNSRSFSDDTNGLMIQSALANSGHQVVDYEIVKDENGIVKRIPDETKEKGYNIVAGKLSFEFSKILNPNDIAPTLVAMDVAKLGIIDGNGLRRLTIRECLRLCGYPDNYSLDMISESEAFDLLGNTVCVPVVKEISEKIGRSYLENSEGELKK